MGKQWSGGTWLAMAFALLGLSLVSTYFAFISGFIFDPDDHPSSYYAAQIPSRLGVMVASVLIPAFSAWASVMSVLATPRKTLRIAISVIALLLALSAIWLCWVLGIEAIQQAIAFADHVPF
ncbi:hypothetical protein RCH16_003171 [Cryobacterium sp. MP_M5]|uniref:hypothetical protein n=1 Tax=unclassified Cryobacterium TaxID=2649013 RepID=UPI0018CAF6A5|nr:MULTISPECIES: hypothetical protein [unclassified Cryobacterium]MBG6059781.1 hypothetical protein [Cryobacterium sp. MP_M3]MEC5178140.1 hypothetical protein [Cryobacterium sp. MP_M5]